MQLDIVNHFINTFLDEKSLNKLSVKRSRTLLNKKRGSKGRIRGTCNKRTTLDSSVRYNSTKITKISTIQMRCTHDMERKCNSTGAFKRFLPFGSWSSHALESSSRNCFNQISVNMLGGLIRGCLQNKIVCLDCMLNTLRRRYSGASSPLGAQNAFRVSRMLGFSPRLKRITIYSKLLYIFIPISNIMLLAMSNAIHKSDLA